MKRYLLPTLLITFLFPFFSFSQEKDTLTPAPAPRMIQKERAPNRIESGFYFKLGPSFPIGNFALEQTFYDRVANSSRSSGTTFTKVTFYPAKMGIAMDMGYLIYIGPAFAGNHLRLGIDASFLDFSYNPAADLPDTISGYTYWYYYIGQKFGPVFSICPIDRLVIDLSYKMNAYIAFVQHPIGTAFKSEFGYNETQNEISMTIRYAIILVSFQYNFGNTTYNNFSTDNPMHKVENNTYRIMIGFKF
jgi:hypothetical protein